MIDNSPQRKVHFLRLVEMQQEAEPVSPDTINRPAWQSTLFAHSNPALAVFIDFDRVTESEFQTILNAARPKFLFDLRYVPRFNLGSLNRRSAFALFTAAGTKYIDLSSQIDELSRSGKDTAPASIAQLIFDSTQFSFATGPVAFIVEGSRFEEVYISNFVENFPAAQDFPWDVLRVPVRTAPAIVDRASRNLVFISHANPEDNDFAFWLGSQLSSAGYAVWSDVTQLTGGEIFWEDIESAIRSKSAKVVCVLSKRSQSKAGVQDEIDLAVRVERSTGLERFIIPVRIDDLPFSDVRANIARKNVIDFSGNWATGLHNLLRTFERDRVPRTANASPDQLARWASVRLSVGERISPQPESLTSNWLPISLPPHVYFHSISASLDQIDFLLGSVRLPHFRYLRLVGTFCAAPDIQAEMPPSVSVTQTYRVETDRLLTGQPREVPGLLRGEAQRYVVAMTRQAWNLEMGRRGLHAFELASGMLAWYFPKGSLEGDRAEFIDEDGKKRKRILVGWSERRQVFWHFAVEARPVLGDVPRFVLRQHVIFTPDGKSPVESKERMHLLRRRFCKSWWNDRWRDLLIAFVSWLNNVSNQSIALGDASAIHLDRTLMRLLSPVSVISDEAQGGLDLDGTADELSDDDEFDEIEMLIDEEGPGVADA